MDQAVARIGESAKGNEEAEALLATIGEGMPAAEAHAVLAQVAAMLGVEFNSDELADDDLAAIAGGVISSSAARHLAREREGRRRMGLDTGY